VTIAGTLVVSRPRGSWLDRRRTYQVVVDGEVKGKVRGGAELALVVKPGRHTVLARNGRAGGPAASFHVGPGATVRMRVDAPGNPLGAPKVSPG
jgi:hypothetical protein